MKEIPIHLRFKSSLLDDAEILDLFLEETGEKKNDIISHIDYIVENDGNLFQLGIDWGFLGFFRRLLSLFIFNSL